MPATPDNDRHGPAGEIRHRPALPATWLGVMAVIFILGLVVLGIVLMTSEPEDRRPTPATPPESLEPADADPLE